MSATGLDVFDRTLKTTNTWLGEIMKQIGPDRQIAWKVLGVEVVFRTLSRHVPRGQIDKVRSVLPGGVRAYWENLEEIEGPRLRDPGRTTTAGI